MTSLTRRLALAAIAPLALATLTACSRTKAGGPVVLNGRIEAPTVDLSPKVAGRVVEVKVREGDRFKAGDLLVTLDLGETGLTVERDRQGLLAAEQRLRDLETGSRKPEIAAAEAEVVDRRAAADLAKKELARQEQLMARKVGVARDLDRARVELERATAALRVSEERLALAREGFRQHQTEGARAEVDRAAAVLAQSETVAREREIRAPADGVVLHRIAEPGLLLGAGQAALTMAFADRLYVTLRAVEKHVTSIFSKLDLPASTDDHRRVLAVLLFLRG